MACSKFLGNKGENAYEDRHHFLVFFQEYMGSFSVENFTRKEFVRLSSIFNSCKSYDGAIKTFCGRVACVFNEVSVVKFMDESSSYLAEKHCMDFEMFNMFLEQADIDVKAITWKCFFEIR